MFKNYALMTFRRLLREKTYFAVTILSLALGIASFLILSLYLRSELTYDEHIADHERIYRVTWNIDKDGGGHYAIAAPSVGPLLINDYPHLGQLVQFRVSRQNIFEIEDVEKQRYWDRVYLTDPSVFDVFSQRILYGDPSTALDAPYSIAISENFASYYFGDENPVGKTVSSGGMTYKVTLVFADLPENTHLKYDALLPMSLMEVFAPGFFSNNIEMLGWLDDRYTYLKVPANVTPQELNAVGREFVDKYMGNLEAELGAKYSVYFQPLVDIHFGEKLLVDLPTGSTFYAYAFAAVALFILFVGCINYTNLATARASKRAKEIGMRGVLGATRLQLIGQFLGESLIFTVIALIAAVVLVEVALALTPIGALMGKENLLATSMDPSVWAGVLLLGLLVTLISGLYPAFYLSAISPLAAVTHVKGSWQTGVSMRQALVFAQLGISISVIICTLLMTAQMRYLHEKPLGFDKENRLIVTLRGYDAVKSLPTIKNELRRQHGVIDVTTIFRAPGTWNSFGVHPTENNLGVMEPMGTHGLSVGMNFVKAMNVEMTQGRSFSENIATDYREARMVNESFVRNAGWDNPIGKRFQIGSDFAYVVGVVRDFHYSSLHNVVGPLLISPMVDTIGDIPEHRKTLQSRAIIVVMSGDGISDTMQRVNDTIRKFDPTFVFEPEFLDDQLSQLYRSETNLMKLTGVFAGICIFISVIGLFGLTAFTTEQRTKEIGIRKVLGASNLQIVTLLSRPVFLLVLVAAVPASAVSYYAIDKWLQRFAYHIEIGWEPFATATLIVAVVTLLTAATQSWKAASAKTIDSLRYE